MGIKGESFCKVGEAEKTELREHLSSQNPGSHLTWATMADHGARWVEVRCKTELSGLWGVYLSCEMAAQGKLCTCIHKAQVSKAALRVSLFNSLFKSLSNSSFTCNDRRLITVTFWPHLFCWHRQVPRLLFSAPHFFPVTQETNPGPCG